MLLLLSKFGTDILWDQFLCTAFPGKIKQKIRLVAVVVVYIIGRQNKLLANKRNENAYGMNVGFIICSNIENE